MVSMMQAKTKKMLNKAFKIALFLAMLACIVWINALKLQEDTLSNYEKITDTGVREYYKEPITPVIAALFYRDEKPQISFDSYFKPKDKNPDKEDVKMAVVPKNVSAFNRPVIEKLYEEIPTKNNVKRVVIIYTDSKNAKEHTSLIKKRFPNVEFTRVMVNQENELSENDIDIYLQNKDTLVVFLANLDRGLNSEKSERLANEAVFFAQKNNYQMNVFDIVDEYIASALESGEDFSYAFSNKVSASDSLAKQKENLDLYVIRYKQELLHHFAKNIELSMQGKDIAVPQKNHANYRLFDRGAVYIKVFNKDYSQVFEELKLNQEDGIVAVIAKIAKDIVSSSRGISGKYYRIYLLTEMEQIHGESAAILANYLEAEDGIYISYKKQAALLLGSDKPTDYNTLIAKLRNMAQIKENVPNESINFYRFKYAEMDYEN